MNKKNILTFVSIILVVLPTCAGAFVLPSQIDNDHYLSLVDTPDWAVGNFVCIVGIASASGKPGPYGGFIFGYYEKEEFKGRFAGVLLKKDTSEISGYIGGYLGGPFMVGIVTNTTSDTLQPIVGLGLSNQTHLYYRIMGLFGPTMYIAGRYQQF